MHLETSPNIDRNLGPSRSYGSSMHGQPQRFLTPNQGDKSVQTGKAQGGKNVYGAAVGFIMLNPSSPHIYGDAGNAATWPFPVLFKVVTDASPTKWYARTLKAY